MSDPGKNLPLRPRRDRRGRRDRGSLYASAHYDNTPDRYFAQLVRQVIRQLPNPLRAFAHTIDIQHRWLPPIDNPDATHGIPLGAVHAATLDTPQQIQLYRQPIVDHCSHPTQLPEVLQVVVTDLVQEAYDQR